MKGEWIGDGGEIWGWKYKGTIEKIEGKKALRYYRGIRIGKTPLPPTGR